MVVRIRTWTVYRILKTDVRKIMDRQKHLAALTWTETEFLMQLIFVLMKKGWSPCRVVLMLTLIPFLTKTIYVRQKKELLLCEVALTETWMELQTRMICVRIQQD